MGGGTHRGEASVDDGLYLNLKCIQQPLKRCFEQENSENDISVAHTTRVASDGRRNGGGDGGECRRSFQFIPHSTLNSFNLKLN